jgi:hypothetical protein
MIKFIPVGIIVLKSIGKSPFFLIPNKFVQSVLGYFFDIQGSVSISPLLASTLMLARTKLTSD